MNTTRRLSVRWARNTRFVNWKSVREVKRPQVLGLIPVIVLGLQTGCFKESVPQQASPPFPPVQIPTVKVTPYRVLAGVWEYEEASTVHPVTFDVKGNGTYKWKEGRMATTSLSNGLWRGTWLQKGNDREGGFEVKLSPDLSKGEGRWWYTRIGDDRSPSRPGGTFHVTRRSPAKQAISGHPQPTSTAVDQTVGLGKTNTFK